SSTVSSPWPHLDRGHVFPDASAGYAHGNTERRDATRETFHHPAGGRCYRGHSEDGRRRTDGLRPAAPGRRVRARFSWSGRPEPEDRDACCSPDQVERPPLFAVL